MSTFKLIVTKSTLILSHWVYRIIAQNIWDDPFLDLERSMTAPVPPQTATRMRGNCLENAKLTFCETFGESKPGSLASQSYTTCLTDTTAATGAFFSDTSFVVNVRARQSSLLWLHQLATQTCTGI